jgi:hypothetical protein
LFLVVGAVAADEKGPPPVSEVDRSAAAGKRTVVAYSFHGTLRCTTCLLVERGAEEAIRVTFADNLADGSLSWRSVNIRPPENQHFATEYQVPSWGLVLVEYRGSTPEVWRNLPLAGELVRADPDAFRRYVTAEVRAFLENAQEMKGVIK